MTGSMGGTNNAINKLEPNIIRLKVLTGKGEIIYADRENPGKYPIDAFLSSVGLLGIVLEVKFKLIKSYWIQGS